MKRTALKKMIEQLYNRSAVGCCLHITLDDENIEDNHVQFCIEEAQRMGHPSCEQVARAILEMTMEERKALVSEPYY